MDENETGKASFNQKFDALARLSKSIIAQQGKINAHVLDAFFDAGYTKENLIDVIVAVGEKTITNLLHNVTGIPLDFPEAPRLEETLSNQS
ncbi:MAG: hypothetical protein JJU28_10235 [Cyclobacteriaceae bacterium]|nr:hypothetical protein [Cyclobacteriaceae bacterium]